MKTKLAIINFATLAALSACAPQHAPVVEAIQASEAAAPETDSVSDFMPSKIIGENNLVKIKADGSNLEASLRPYLDSFGLIAMGQRGSCSGTHLGNGYVLTAGHCFLDTSAPLPQSAAGKACADVKVYWGYRGSVATGSAKPVVSSISTCTQMVYAELTKNTDFAIFKVNTAPKSKITISTEAKRTAANTKLTIFGYPQGRPLEWSQYCALKNVSALGAVNFKGAETFVHQCDTEPGNSGSSIVAVTASGNVKVIGVHDGSTPAEYNYGTYMYDIRTILKKKGFDLDKASVTAATLSI